MALTDEQRAMLQLLLEGGQGYEDIGSLLGIGPDEVRSRARSALQEIGGVNPDNHVVLSDYLLGQADPIGRADAVRYLQGDPEANALAQRLVQNLRLLAPSAQLPEIPEPRGGRRAAPPPPPPAQVAPTATQAATPATAAPTAPTSPPGAPVPPAPQGPGFAARAAGFFSGLGEAGKRHRAGFAVGLAAALAAVIVIIVVATSGGGGGSSDCKPLDTSAAQQAGVPTVPLTAVGDAAKASCKPAGQVTLVAVPGQSQKGKSQGIAGFALQTNAVHLDPTQSGEQYILWLTGSNGQARPLGRETVNSDGNLNGAAPLPTQQLVFLQALQTIRLSKVSGAQSQQVQQALQVQQSSKQPTGLVQFVGTPVLEGSGTQLLQQLQQQLQQAQSQGGSSTQGATGKKG